MDGSSMCVCEREREKEREKDKVLLFWKIGHRTVIIIFLILVIVFFSQDVICFIEKEGR